MTGETHHPYCNNCKGQPGCPNKTFRASIHSECPWETYPANSERYQRLLRIMLLVPSKAKELKPEKTTKGRPK